MNRTFLALDEREKLHSRANGDQTERSDKTHGIKGQETERYRKLVNVYVTERTKSKRVDNFCDNYTKLRMKVIRENLASSYEQNIKRDKKNERVIEELRKTRARFEESKIKRLNKQYVTTKVLEHEKEGRFSFGLPLLLPEKSTVSKDLMQRVPERLEAKEGKLRKIAEQNYGQLFYSFNFPNTFDKRIEFAKASGMNKQSGEQVTREEEQPPSYFQSLFKTWFHVSLSLT